LRSQRVLRSDAVERAIYKDLPQAFEIGEPVKLERLLYALAGQVGGMISPKTLAADLELSQMTIDRYVRYLEQAFLIFTLPNYSTSEETVQRRGRKVYFTDPAVRNAALQRGLAPLRDPGELGSLYENAVAAHLHALAQQTGSRLYYYRHGRDEVDLVLDHPRQPLAFEIGSSAAHGRRGLGRLIGRHSRFRGAAYLIYPGATHRSARKDVDGIGQVPLEGLLALASAHVDVALGGGS
jgi:predicted AAA+ superfamily ATPase